MTSLRRDRYDAVPFFGCVCPAASLEPGGIRMSERDEITSRSFNRLRAPHSSGSWATAARAAVRAWAGATSYGLSYRRPHFCPRQTCLIVRGQAMGGLATRMSQPVFTHASLPPIATLRGSCSRRPGMSLSRRISWYGPGSEIRVAKARAPPTKHVATTRRLNERNTVASHKQHTCAPSTCIWWIRNLWNEEDTQ